VTPGAALPDPLPPEPQEPEREPPRDDVAASGELVERDSTVATGEIPKELPDASSSPRPAVVAATLPDRTSVRRGRTDRWRPRPGITLLTFVLGIAVGAAVFVGRLEPPPAPESLPDSPYQSLGATNAAPFPVAVLMQGLTSSADQVPRIVPDPALGQLRRVLGEFAVVTSVEHQATIAVGNEGISAIIIRGIDRQGRTALATLTAHLRDNQIVEFR
jgi:hypothetical protein